MPEENFISVGVGYPELERFSRFMQVTTDKLRNDAKTNNQFYSKQNGEKLEQVVLDKMRTVAPEFNICPEDICHTPKQHFPDILMGNNFGVEVKSTKEKSWISTGSSIVESLRDDQVQRVFLMFGRLSAPDIDFRCKPYEDCLYDIAVTHSPRYLINMDLRNKNQTIFSKMNIGYDEFRNCDSQIDVVRDYYREKFRKNGKKGEMPWWIGDKRETIIQYEPSSLRNSDNIRMMNNLDTAVIDYLKICGYILFPEIVGKGTSKYQNFALWLCSRYSIICSSLRDQFSAGGQGNIYVDDNLKWRNVPKVICNLLTYIDKIRSIMINHTDVFNEIGFYSSYLTSDSKDITAQWIKEINIRIKQISDVKSLTAEALLNLRFEYVIGNDFYARSIR